MKLKVKQRESTFESWETILINKNDKIKVLPIFWPTKQQAYDFGLSYIHKRMKQYTLEEIKDMTLGKVGTPKRDEYEAEMKAFLISIGKDPGDTPSTDDDIDDVDQDTRI